MGYMCSVCSESVLGKGSQVGAGLTICGQIILHMWCLSIRHIKETLDIHFRSTGDDNSQPLSMCGCVAQDPQDIWMTFIITTFVECIDYKDKSMLWVMREAANEVKEDKGLHQFWCQVWVAVKAFCHNPSKRGEDSGEFVDESQKDISWFAQIQIIPSAEEGPSKVFLIVKPFTDQMS